MTYVNPCVSSLLFTPSEKSIQAYNSLVSLILVNSTFESNDKKESNYHLDSSYTAFTSALNSLLISVPLALNDLIPWCNKVFVHGRFLFQVQYTKFLCISNHNIEKIFEEQIHATLNHGLTNSIIDALIEWMLKIGTNNYDTICNCDIFCCKLPKKDNLDKNIDLLIAFINILSSNNRAKWEEIAHIKLSEFLLQIKAKSFIDDKEVLIKDFIKLFNKMESILGKSLIHRLKQMCMNIDTNENIISLQKGYFIKILYRDILVYGQKICFRMRLHLVI